MWAGRTTAAGILATTLLLAGCSGGDTPSAPTSSPPATPSASPESPEPTAAGTTSASPSVPSPPPDATPTVVGDVATGLRAPWSMAFLPDGTALVSQRDEASIAAVNPGGAVTPVGVVPGVVPQGEGGLLGIAVAPSFATDRLVYAYFSAGDDNRIARMRYEGGSLGAPEVILQGIPKSSNHNGGRLAFGPDGFLYATTGDALDLGTPPDPDSLAGKILRLTPDGQPAPGNPFPGSPVWSIGHRNVQGIAWDSQGRLWASEFGQDSFDELNLIEPGANYGWPEVEGTGGGDEFVDPVATWATDDASPSGIAIAGDEVYMAALRGARLWQIGTEDIAQNAFFTGEYGRLRDVAYAPDGTLWVLTNNTDGRGNPRAGDDRILRVELR